jgi:hypothetical protein
MQVASSSLGTVESYSAQIDSNQLFTLYAQSNGLGSITKTRAIFGTSTATVLDSTNIPYGSVLISDGALCVDNGAGNTCASSARTRGFVYAEGSSLAGLDLAEVYLSKDSTLQKGEVVVFDSANSRYVSRLDLASTTQANKKFAGIVSSDPGLLLGGFSDATTTDAKISLALAGRVPVIVNNEGGAINIGDPIMPANASGAGRKATTSGMILGFALEPASFTYGATSTIDVFVNYTYRFADEQLFVDPTTGNVGIGTTTPQYKLTVAGAIGAESFVNISTRDAKKDITYLSDAENKGILDKLSSLMVARYTYTDEQSTTTLEGQHLGLIAEESPLDILSPNLKGIDLYKLVSYILSGVKALAVEVKDLAAKVAGFDTEVKTKKLCLDDVCVTKDQLQALLTGSGVSGVGGSSSGGGSTGTTTNSGTTTDTVAPTIVLNGNNPAEIQVGTSYVDLGATVTDNVDQNLGFTMTPESIDTSTSTSYTIVFTATDAAGNTASTTRIVNVVPITP